MGLVTLLIEGATINCFISYCPYPIEVGKTYDVELTMNLPDDYEIEKIAASRILAEKTGHGYANFFNGELRDDNFLTFTSLNDEGIHYDHPDCNEHFIKLKVERIDAGFY